MRSWVKGFMRCPNLVEDSHRPVLDNPKQLACHPGLQQLLSLSCWDCALLNLAESTRGVYLQDPGSERLVSTSIG